MSIEGFVMCVHSGADRSHHLNCHQFADAFPSLVEMVLPHTTTAIVWLDDYWLEADPDGDECQRTWDNIRTRFERIPDDDYDGYTTWRCSTKTESDALFELISLINGIAGRHFLFRIELRNRETPVLDSIPHTPDAGIDASQLDESIKSDDIVGLPGHAACLVPAKTHVEWVAEDRRWSLQGGHLCVKTLDGRTTKCYGLTNLQQAVVADEETVLALVWNAGELPDDPIGKMLSWIMDKFYNPPPAVPCGTTARAQEVQEYVRKLQAAYDETGLNPQESSSE